MAQLQVRALYNPAYLTHVLHAGAAHSTLISHSNLPEKRPLTVLTDRIRPASQSPASRLFSAQVKFLTRSVSACALAPSSVVESHEKKNSTLVICGWTGDNLHENPKGRSASSSVNRRAGLLHYVDPRALTPSPGVSSVACIPVVWCCIRSRTCACGFSLPR